MRRGGPTADNTLPPSQTEMQTPSGGACSPERRTDWHTLNQSPIQRELVWNTESIHFTAIFWGELLAPRISFYVTKGDCEDHASYRCCPRRGADSLGEKGRLGGRTHGRLCFHSVTVIPQTAASVFPKGKIRARLEASCDLPPPSRPPWRNAPEAPSCFPAAGRPWREALGSQPEPFPTAAGRVPRP